MRHLTPSHWVVRACLLWLALVLVFVVAEPLPDSLVSRHALSEIEQSRAELQPRDNSTFLLRILPLGASITLGWKSTDHNGYRKWIRQQLRYAGWQVDMIGSLKNGTMHDNQHEGHFGYRIDQLYEKAEKIIPHQPNLILINAGTNDALQKHEPGTAGMRMGRLLTKLYDEIPGTTIILSTLLPNKKQPRLVWEISEQLRVLAALRRAKGERLVLAEMSSFIKSSQLVDDTHPDDTGYKEMASVWWAAIQQAHKEGMLQKAANTSLTGMISKSVEKELDDSNSDPDLPAYTAVAQPSVNFAVEVVRRVGRGLISMFCMMSELYCLAYNPFLMW
ncbi:CAZyme family CE3 [Penicillium macrosclerotiorum]|uniref:CAZyme family CE3 n=1 Tax=Penicillium macrosclerotiorum TaxID=303699 RepID=UPI0025483487|nr:CAZyme family CE3 [Penicillium macrosclerotiorum]KAJ5675743.1 CAZyme family CE3 [Penicillium macrosclerotiorum]